MSEQQIGDMLRRGTEHLPAPDLATAALEGARRHRRRRAAMTGGVAAVAAAVAVPFALDGVDGEPGPAPASRGPQPAAATGHITAPAPDESVVAPVLDPEDIAALPTYDAGLPTVLEPDESAAKELADDPLDHAVAVVKADGLYLDDFDLAQDLFYALGEDGDWRRVRVDAPSDLAGDRGPVLLSESLSPDGTRVALKGDRAIYVVDLADGSTTKVRTGRGAGMTAWQPDSTHLLVPQQEQGFVVDVTTGGRTPAAWAADTDSGPFTGAYEPGGRLLHVAPARGGELENVVESQGERVDLDVEADDIGQPVYFLPNARDVAMNTYPMIDTGRRLRGRDDGLLVVDRERYRASAFLPVAGPEGHYLNDDALRPRTWLDDHTLLFSVRPSGTSQDESETGQFFLAWDTESGQVSRVAESTLLWRSVSLLPAPID